MNRRTTIILSVALLLSLSRVGHAQQHNNPGASQKVPSYGFVSPNKRENLKLDEAVENLRSADEDRLVDETGLVACRVRAPAHINKSLGNWADGAENSLIFRIYSDDSTVRYAVATLGRHWRQKTVLYFRRQAAGKARMYLLSIRRSREDINQMLRNVSKLLDDAGVSYRTLVPLTDRVMVYVVDLSNELQPQVQNAARRLHVRTLVFAGTGGFIGNDGDRDQAQAVYAQEIKSYETKHALRKDCLRDAWKRQ